MIERPHVLLLGENCLELDKQKTGGGFDFERRCLLTLANDIPSLLVLGPRFVEGILLKMTYAGPQPDVMLFSQGVRQWKLLGMAEIKAGKINGIKRKLDGMKQIACQLRGYPEEFVNALAFFFGDLTQPITTPQRLCVPPNNQIKVYFANPGNRFPQGKIKGCDFKVSHLRYGG